MCRQVENWRERGRLKSPVEPRDEEAPGQQRQRVFVKNLLVTGISDDDDGDKDTQNITMGQNQIW